MKVIGAKWTCERCQKEEFKKLETQELPNGKKADYYPLPESWGYTVDAKELCPNCLEKYKRIRKEFFGEKK